MDNIQEINNCIRYDWLKTVFGWKEREVQRMMMLKGATFSENMEEEAKMGS
jgi:hypothetical protein